MRRREFITLLGGAAARGRWRRVRNRPNACGGSACSYPAASDDAENQTWVGAFLQGLQQLGWTIGRNLRIDARLGGTDMTPFASMQWNWSLSRRMSFWLTGNGPVAALRQVTPHFADRVPRGRRPGRHRLLSTAWRGRAAMPLALLSSNSV